MGQAFCKGVMEKGVRGRERERESESAVVQPIVWSGYRDDVTFCNAHTIRRQEIERRAVMMQEHRVWFIVEANAASWHDNTLQQYYYYNRSQ